MKKILAVILSVVMVLTLLAACGNNNGTAVMPTESGASAQGSTHWKKFNKTAVTTETVATAANGCSITVAPVEYLDDSLAFDVVFENPTDMNVVFDLDSVAVNKVMMHEYTYAKIEPGESYETTLTFYMDDLRLRGVIFLASLEAEFTLSDEDNWEELERLTFTIESDKVGDLEVDTGAFYNAVNSTGARRDLGFTLLDAQQTQTDVGNGLTLITMGAMAYGDTANNHFFMELYNDSDETAYADWYVAELNGLEMAANPDWGDVLPGCRIVLFWHTEYQVSETMRQAFGIESVVNYRYKIETADGERNNSVETEGFYEIPGSEATLDMTAEVLYDDGDVKISAKEVVESEWGYSYIYLIVESDEDAYVSCNSDEIEVDGSTGYIWCGLSCWLDEGEMAIESIEIENLDADSITLPVEITTYDEYDVVAVDLVIYF